MKSYQIISNIVYLLLIWPDILCFFLNIDLGSVAWEPFIYNIDNIILHMTLYISNNLKYNTLSRGVRW